METTDHLTENGLELHSLSQIVPEMTPEDFGRLKESIAQRGFLVEHSIVLFEGRILDGGHRYKAAQQLGVTPTFREFIGSEAQARAFILASNADRRHLTKSQVAQVFVNANALAPEKSQLTTKQISAQSGATEKAVRDAQKLREKNPDDAAKVASGEKPAGKAKAKAGISPPAGRVRQQACRGWAWLGTVRPVSGRSGARHCTCLVRRWSGKGHRGMARRGRAWQCSARLGSRRRARPGEARQGFRGRIAAGSGKAGLGLARRGAAVARSEAGSRAGGERHPRPAFSRPPASVGCRAGRAARARRARPLMPCIPRYAPIPPSISIVDSCRNAFRSASSAVVMASVASATGTTATAGTATAAAPAAPAPNNPKNRRLFTVMLSSRSGLLGLHDLFPTRRDRGGQVRMMDSTTRSGKAAA